MATKPTPSRKPVIRPVERHLILKAKDGDDPVAVFDQHGKLLGIVDPSKITPVSNPGGDAAPPTEAPVTKQRPKPARPARLAQPKRLTGAEAQAAALAIKKGLYAGGDVADRERLAKQMNAAAIEAEKKIHGQRRWL